LSGLVRPDEVVDQVGVVLPDDEDYETLGGLIATKLGRVPEQGDAVELEVGDDEGGRRLVTLTVVAMDDLRVDRVRLTHRPIEGEG
ncbi:MAG TPA: transporter associated domain-containing protein, partial [Solirubrobacterales bacterium]|nr:transporter associated domain-containing protein [Solirubrobacterales bacterium]